jgi:predicted TIM-barrel fold metal-dependent hydrolase
LRAVYPSGSEDTMTTLPAIDMWAPILPTPEILRYAAAHFPKEMLGYLRVFYKEETTLEAFRARAASIECAEEDVVAMLDAAGITRMLITGFDERSSCGETWVANECIAPIATRYPDRFIPYAGADVLAGMSAVREFAYWVRERGFRGLSLRPFMIGVPADDRRYYPLYAKCVELGVPVSIHTSANWTTMRDSDLGHPRHLDVVAGDFPELTIIISHGGYPWVLEAVLLAWKHPRVYLELAAHRPKYFATPGTGWEPLLRFGQTTIADKVLFGSGWFLLGRPPVAVLDEFRALPVKPAVMEKWLSGNAERVLATPPAIS